jgi:hypothetical protein
MYAPRSASPHCPSRERTASTSPPRTPVSVLHSASARRPPLPCAAPPRSHPSLSPTSTPAAALSVRMKRHPRCAGLGTNRQVRVTKPRGPKLACRRALTGPCTCHILPIS